MVLSNEISENQLNIAQRYEQVLAGVNAQLNQMNAITGAFANTIGGNFKDAGENIQELHNPIFRLNAAFISAQHNARKLGVDMETAMTQASLRADLLAQRMEMVRSRFLSLPRAFMSQMNAGMQVESDRIQASAGIMRSEYAKSIPEANRIISQVRAVVLRESAPLPGDTKTHLDVLSQTIDDSMKMAKDAGKSIEEAQKFSAAVAGQIGAIGGSANADQYSIMRFANALMSGSLSANSRIDLVERNPAVKNAMKEVFKARGVRTLEGLSKDKRFDAVKEILDKAMPADQLEAASASFSGALEGFNTSVKSLFDFTRTVNDTFEAAYEGPDITVFDELSGIAIQLINPMKSLLDAIIANPVVDPMRNLVRSVTLLNGFFGNTLRDEKQFQGMDFKEATRQLGFIDFGKYLSANADSLVKQMVRGDKTIFGVENRGDTFAGANFGRDVPSQIINALVSKFRMGVDNAFAAINGFLNTSTFLNGLDIGGSIGTIIAELTNSAIYLFNQLLPIIIDQTTSMFRAIKERINITDLIRFAQLFSGFRTIWSQLQEKIANIANDAPKLFNKVTEGAFKFSSIFGGVGMAVTLFGGMMVSGTASIQGAIARLVTYINAKTGQTGTGSFLDRTDTRMQNRRRRINEARERIDFFALDERERQARLRGMNATERQRFTMNYDARARERDYRTIGGRVGGFIGQHQRYSDRLEPLGMFNPLGFMQNFGVNSAGQVRRNAVQRAGASMSNLIMPMMMASGAGIVPGQLAGTYNAVALGTSVVGNVMNMMGRRGLDPTDPRRIANERREARFNQLLMGRLRQGNLRGASRAIGGMVRTRTGAFGNIVGRVLMPILNLFGKIPPGLITAVASNLPLMLGSLTFIMGIFKRAYAASPKLQQAVGRFLTGIRNIFDQLSRVVMPLYKRYIQPLFKLLGDALAFIFNGLMNFLNRFTGNAFGDENSGVNVSVQEAQDRGADFRRQRTEQEDEAIKRGRRNARAAFMGFDPGIMSINAATGFGQINVPSLMQAATMEAKMAPANTQLVVANTSETILTAEQMQARLLMEQSRASITIPKIDIMITGTENQNPTMLANEVATVLMSKLRDAENLA